MIRKKLAHNVGYPLYDIITGCKTLSIFKFLKDSQRWSLEELKQFQLQKLRILLNHCYKNVPYYHNLSKKLEISPNCIKSIEDIEKIPILTKNIIRNQGEHMISITHTCNNWRYNGITIAFSKG